MWHEFRAFAMRGNVVDLAVGIILGTAFPTIVNSLVNDLIIPPLGLLIGGLDRHYEIVFVQDMDFLGAQERARRAPTETEVGLLAFAFGQPAGVPDKDKGAGEIRETVGALDPAGVIEQGPVRRLAAIFLG